MRNHYGGYMRDNIPRGTGSAKGRLPLTVVLILTSFLGLSSCLKGVGPNGDEPVGADPGPQLISPAMSTSSEVLKLKVGESVGYTPGFLPAQVVCDDLSVVRVEDAGTRFRLVGLKAGATDCGFFNIAYPHHLLHIVVVDK